MAKQFKESISNAATSLLVGCLGVAKAERVIYQLCQPPWLRRGFHTGSLAYQFMQYLNANEIRQAQLDEYKLFVDIREDRGLDSYFFHSLQVPWIVAQLLQPGDVFIDIGPNMVHWP